MHKTIKKIFPSKISIIGTFAILSFVLTIPIVVLFSQQEQHIQIGAQGPSPTFEVPNIAQTPQGTISGYVFYDTNKNGQRTSGEPGFPHATVTISSLKNGDYKSQDQTTVYTTKTDANGYFTYHLSTSNSQTSTYFVTVTLPNGYKTLDTNPVIFSNLYDNNSEIVQFGLFSIVQATPIPICIPRPSCIPHRPQCEIAIRAVGYCPQPTEIISPVPQVTSE